MYPTKFSPHSSQISKTRTLDGDYPCKEEATSVNARDTKKKGHFTIKYFFKLRIRCSYARKPYTRTGSLPRHTLRFPYELGVLGFHVECPNDFVGVVNHDSEANCPTDVHVFQPVDHAASAVMNQKSIDDDQR